MKRKVPTMIQRQINNPPTHFINIVEGKHEWRYPVSNLTQGAGDTVAHKLCSDGRIASAVARGTSSYCASAICFVQLTKRWVILDSRSLYTDLAALIRVVCEL